MAKDFFEGLDKGADSYFKKPAKDTKATKYPDAAHMKAGAKAIENESRQAEAKEYLAQSDDPEVRKKYGPKKEDALRERLKAKGWQEDPENPGKFDPDLGKKEMETPRPENPDKQDKEFEDITKEEPEQKEREWDPKGMGFEAAEMHYQDAMLNAKNISEEFQARADYLEELMNLPVADHSVKSILERAKKYVGLDYSKNREMRMRAKQNPPEKKTGASAGYDIPGKYMGD